MIRVLGPHAREFQGRVYRRNPQSRWSGDRKYFKPSLKDMRAGVRALHVEIWKAVKGPIPPGHQVHHRTGNTNRNRFRDLKLLKTVLHQHHHRPRDLSAVRAHLASIRPVKGSSWHARGLLTRARRKRSRRRRARR